MSGSAERRLRDVPADFPRPDDRVTRRVEDKLRGRARQFRRRRRRPRGSMVVSLCAGAVLGAGLVAVAAGAATDRVTLSIQPPVGVLDADTHAVGTVSNGRAGEKVVFEIRECGQSRFRVLEGATTGAGGGYAFNLIYQIWTNSMLRARWKSAVSEDVEVKRRIYVALERYARNRWRSGPVNARFPTKGIQRFRVTVRGVDYFAGKRVRIERWDPRGRWVLVRLITLKRLEGVPRPSGGPWDRPIFPSGSEFRMNARRGTQLRAVFPTEGAAPCYIEGASTILRM
jgi:hypothetical protein